MQKIGLWSCGARAYRMRPPLRKTIRWHDAKKKVTQRERFKILGSVVFSEIRASTVGSNGEVEGAEEERRRRG